MLLLLKILGQLTNFNPQTPHLVLIYSLQELQTYFNLKVQVNRNRTDACFIRIGPKVYSATGLLLNIGKTSSSVCLL